MTAIVLVGDSQDLKTRACMRTMGIVRLVALRNIDATQAYQSIGSASENDAARHSLSNEIRINGFLFNLRIELLLLAKASLL